MTWRPCWRKANKRITLTAIIVFGACFPPTYLCLVNPKRLQTLRTANHYTIYANITNEYSNAWLHAYIINCSRTPCVLTVFQMFYNSKWSSLTWLCTLFIFLHYTGIINTLSRLLDCQNLRLSCTN
jgi:hypothetical protein